MHENIEKLIDQVLPTGDLESEENGYTFTQEELAKLTHLLIKECVDQCRQVWYNVNNESIDASNMRMLGISIGKKQGSLICIRAIKDHFGIKE